MKDYKLFVNNETNEISFREIESRGDYYKLIKEEQDDWGNSQLIITDYIARSILKEYFTNKGYEIRSIVFESEELNEEVKGQLMRTQLDRVHFNELFSSFMQDEYFVSMEIGKQEETITFKSNGIVISNVGISEELLDVVSSAYF